MRKIDMIGRPFGRLTVIREAPSPKTARQNAERYYWGGDANAI